MLDALLKEDLRLRKRTADAAPPVPAKSAASNGRAVWYVQQFAKIFAQLLTDPVLKPIFAQMDGAAPAARGVVGSETLPPAEVPTPENPSGEGTERLLPSTVGDSAPHTLSDLLPKQKRDRETTATVLRNIFKKGR
jgi:hypothetical protein